MADTLRLGVSGARVAALHERLAARGLDVPVAEQRADHFGSGTAAAIEQAQRRAGLPITGAIDDATARLLGIESAHPTAITGVVGRPDGSPLAGVRVTVFRTA